MAYPKSRLAISCIAIVALAHYAQASSRVNNQFGNVASYQNEVLKWAFVYENGCKKQYDVYRDARIPDQIGHEKAFLLLDCLLDKTPEGYKADMASTGIVLGLLPALLTRVGPTLAETSLLALRRPVLAFLLGLGSPSINTGFGELYGNPMQALATRPRVNPRPWRCAHPLAKVAISLGEYLVAAAAVSNVLYTAYRLTYSAICWSAIALYITGVPETSIVFIWAALVPTSHALGCLWRRYRVVHNMVPPPSSHSPPIESAQKGVFCSAVLWRYLSEEATPSVYGKPLRAMQRSPGYVLVLIEHALSLFSLVHVIMGTVILSTVLFLELSVAVQIVAQILCGSICSRLVLQYELNGTRHVYSA